MEYSVNLTLEQIEAPILACGIAARNSTPATELRIRAVLVDLIHAKVTAEYAEADRVATSKAVEAFASFKAGKE